MPMVKAELFEMDRRHLMKLTGAMGVGIGTTFISPPMNSSPPGPARRSSLITAPSMRKKLARPCSYGLTACTLIRPTAT